MTRKEALQDLERFIHDNLRAKQTGGSFYQIDGGRICSTCRLKKRRTLYMIFNYSSPVMLKCFRASCTSEHLKNGETDPTKAVLITADILRKFGYNNEEAIGLITNVSNLVMSRRSRVTDGSLLINDRLLSPAQLDYMEKRCKFRPTAEDALEYNIVPGLHSVIEDNDIELEDTTRDILNGFNKNNSISFSTGDGHVVITRKLTNNGITKNILNVHSGVTTGGYTIGDSDGSIETLVISEGNFDIINARRFFARPEYLGNTLYVAALGYDKIAKLIEMHYFKNIDKIKRLIIFMDSDITNQVMGKEVFTYNKKHLKNIVQTFSARVGITAFQEVALCYNTRGKDCGDMSEPIKMVRENINIVELLSKPKQKFRKYKRGNK